MYHIIVQYDHIEYVPSKCLVTFEENDTTSKVKTCMQLSLDL